LDLGIISLLAINGVLMTALSANIVIALFAAALMFAFILDFLKLLLFKRLLIA